MEQKLPDAKEQKWNAMFIIMIPLLFNQVKPRIIVFSREPFISTERAGPLPRFGHGSI